MNRQDGVAVCLALAALVAVLAGVSGAAVAGDGAPGQTDVVQTATTGQLESSGQAAVATTPAQTGDNSIDIYHEFRLTPDEPGQVDVQWTVDIPDNVPRLNVTNLPSSARNLRLDGFVKRDGELRWNEDDQSTRTPSATFTLPVNETTDDGSPKFADTGDWALIRRPPLASVEYLYYTNQPKPTVTRTNRTAGPGVTSDSMVYLGPHEMTTRSAHGQQFRLVVPEVATLRESKADIFDSVTAASDTLRVGDRDPTVTMVAAPTSVPWGVAGLQTGDAGFYTIANQTVDEADNTWLHEYVHTRQSFETRNATRWFTEASAEYYAAQLTLQQGRIDFDTFSYALSDGASNRYDDVVLANPDTWHDSANYEKGGLVAGDIDRRIRLATDSGSSLQAVFQRLNSHGSPVGQQTFLRAVENAGGSSVRETAQRFTETTAGPEMWTQAEHDEAFGDLPAQFSVTFPDVGSDGLRIRGPFRNETATDEPLVTGETLVVDLTVANVGGSAGTYNFTVTRNGVPVANRTGTAASGENVTETVEFTFEDPGTYRLSTGSDALSVRVREPATPTVTDVYANRTSLQGGGTVRVTAVVRNDQDVPATGVITLQQDGDTLLEQRVYLDSNAGTELSETVRLSTVGMVQFTAGGQAVEVTIEEPTPTPESGGETDGGTAGESGPGFGMFGALVALGVSLLVGHRIE